MGEYQTYPDLESAVKKYQEILDDPRRRYQGNGMGIIYHGEQDDIYNNSECCLVSERVVCGNELDQTGLGEKEEVREALHMLRDAFHDFRYKIPKYEKEAGTALISAEDLAVQIDHLAHDFAPYHYEDRLDGQTNLVQDITYSLYMGGRTHYMSLLEDIIKNGGSLATEADRLKERLVAFEPSVSADREPVVRVDFCDSKDAEFEKYMPIGAFDEAVRIMDKSLNSKNAGHAEDEIETGIVQFTVYYPDDGKMKKLRDTIDVGYGNGGFISTLTYQIEDRLTDENWLDYKRRQGQLAYDSFIGDLTNLLENVLPHLKTFCREAEGIQVHTEITNDLPMETYGEGSADVSYPSKNSGKVSRNGDQTARQNGRRSIHERLASNKTRIEQQLGKVNPVKGVERTC